MTSGAYRARAVVSRLVGLPERMLLSRLRLRHRYPPLFVVGVPRSGTTLTGQVLMNAFRWAYLPALANSYPGACLSMTALVRLFACSPAPTYDSDYGRMRGVASLSDGWEVFHRWFPRYRLDEPVRRDRLVELQNLVAALERLYGAPFLIKNNNNSTRIAVLRELFPDALWVHVQRDPLDTSLSLLEARRTFGVPLNEWWSAAPPDYWNRSFADEYDQVAHQVVGLERSVREALEGLSDGQRLTLPYRALCDQPTDLLGRVRAFYRESGVTLSERAHAVPVIQFRSSRDRAGADRDRMAAALDLLRPRDPRA